MSLEDKPKLPATYRGKVGTKWRVTVPTYLSFIEPKDYISGYITIIQTGEQIPFKEKMINVSRMFSIGNLLRHLPRNLDPKSIAYVDVTIEQVKKSTQLEAEVEFNVLLYHLSESNPVLVYSLESLSTSLQFTIDNYISKLAEEIFGSTFAKFKFFEPLYLDNHELWLAAIFFSIKELVLKHGYFLVIVVDLEHYQSFVASQKALKRLIRRFVSWVNGQNNINVATLSRLSGDIQKIIFFQQEPQYYNLSKIMLSSEPEKHILINLLRAHRANEVLSIQDLIRLTKQDQWQIEESIDSLLHKGLIYEAHEDSGTIFYDIFWYA